MRGRRLIAAGIPLLLAGTAVTSAISLLAIPSRRLPVGSTTSSVVLLVGMAVGVDYTLFYLRREREERAAGADTSTAVRKAAATSGRAIVVSGLTVMISLSGLHSVDWLNLSDSYHHTASGQSGGYYPVFSAAA